MSSETAEKPCAGHIMIVVIPYLEDRASALNLKPMVNRLLLEEIHDFTRSMTSPFAQIEVRNPVYEKIQVRCMVNFKKGASSGYYINKLNQDIMDYLSPWNQTGYNVRFGWCIRQPDIELYIQERRYVNFVTKFSMLHITDKNGRYFTLYDTAKSRKKGDPHEIKPVYPWSIAIPVERHFIKTIDRIESRDAHVTGLEELDIGNTFIITG